MLIDSKTTSLTAEDMLSVISMINESHTLNDLIEGWFDIMAPDIASYHHFDALGSFSNMSRYYSYKMPQAFVDYFNDDRKAKDDVVVLKVFSTGNCVWLSEFDIKSFDPDLVSAMKTSDYYIVDGICMPLYGPNNRLGFMFMAYGLSKDEMDPILAHKLQSLAQRFHVRYCLIAKGLQKQVNLTQRESEVLELIAFGKANPEIAIILDISTNTVAGYVKSIFLKLETNDRVTAAIRYQSMKVVI